MAILALIIFLALMIFINVKNIGVKSFDDYATSRGSFGVIGVSMGIFATWYVGASFTAFASFNVGLGFTGLYVITYASMMLISMYLLSEKTYLWGKKYSIQTQAELMDLRYKSKFLRVLVALSGIVFITPWLLMEWVTQGYIFSYATNGVVSPFWGMVIGVGVVLIYVATGGMKSVITANIFQGTLMFIIGVGLSFYLIYYFFGSFSQSMENVLETNSAALTYPGPGWDPPTPYWTSIIIASGLGAFMWPWAFNKVFIANSLRSIKQSALLAPILGLVFWAAIVLLGIAIHPMEIPRTNPEEAYMWISQQAGPLPLALMSTVIMAASVATAAGIIQAASTLISNDIAKIINRRIDDKTAVKISRFAVILIGALAFIGASIDMGSLIFLALTSYQGIIMLFPVVFLGLFWKRANKEGAIISILAGTSFAMYCEVAAPTFIAEYGWTGGMYGLAISFIIMTVAGFLKEPESHVDKLWEDIAIAKGKISGKHSEIQENETSQESI